MFARIFFDNYTTRKASTAHNRWGETLPLGNSWLLKYLNKTHKGEKNLTSTIVNMIEWK